MVAKLAPSNAKKLKHEIRRLISQKPKILLKNKELALDNEIKALDDLVEMEWRENVDAVANQELNNRRFYRPETPIPSMDDIKKLNNHIKKEAERTPLTIEHFRRHQELVQASSIITNKRRAGELDAAL